VNGTAVPAVVGLLALYDTQELTVLSQILIVISVKIFYNINENFNYFF